MNKSHLKSKPVSQALNETKIILGNVLFLILAPITFTVQTIRKDVDYKNLLIALFQILRVIITPFTSYFIIIYIISKKKFNGENIGFRNNLWDFRGLLPHDLEEKRIRDFLKRKK